MPQYVSTIVTVLDKENSNSKVFITDNAYESLEAIMVEYDTFIQGHKLVATSATMNPATKSFSFSGKNFSFHAMIIEMPA